MPSELEVLRRRLHVLVVSYVMANGRHPATQSRKRATHEAWREHVEYILGEKVYGLGVPGFGDQAGPERSVALAYDNVFRKGDQGHPLRGLRLPRGHAQGPQNTEFRELTFVPPTMASIFTWIRRGSVQTVGRLDRSMPQNPGKARESRGKRAKVSHGGATGAWHVKTAHG